MGNAQDMQTFVQSNSMEIDVNLENFGRLESESVTQKVVE